MGDEWVIEECLRGVAKIHGLTYKAVQMQFIRGVVKNWGLDPNTLGAFVFARPHFVSVQRSEKKWKLISFFLNSSQTTKMIWPSGRVESYSPASTQTFPTPG